MLTDHRGRHFEWGWNHAGCGLGEHAEQHALRRANPARVSGATITVYGRRRASGHPVLSWPCAECLAALVRAGVANVAYFDKRRWRHRGLRPPGWPIVASDDRALNAAIRALWAIH